MTKLAVLGAGVMGEALASGILSAGWSPADLVLCDVRGDHVRAVAARLGVEAFDSAPGAVVGADAVLLAVKPQDGEALLRDITLDGKCLISIMPLGWSTDRLEALAPGAQVVRAMPNTPAIVRSGVTALAAGASADATARSLAQAIFEPVGAVVWLDEKHMDAVTALSGSGPAYVFLFAEALVDAGVAAGLPRSTSETLAYATLQGAALLLAESSQHPAVLRAQVTTPGGTTAAGVAELERLGLRAAVMEAVRAAQRRSKESS